MDIHQIYWHDGEHFQMSPDRFSYCPICGEGLVQEIIDRYPRKACLHCGFVHFRNPSPTVSLLIVEGDQVLLGKRAEQPGEDRWATPSGYIEFDEDFLSTAVREAKEETGLEVEIAAILNVTDSFFPPDQHFINVYLLAHPSGGQLQAGDDVGELRWFPLLGPLPEMFFKEDIDLIERFRQPGWPYLPVEKPALA